MRKTLSILAGIGVLLFGYVTLTIPAFEATAPALITIAFAVASFLLWPRHKKDVTA